MLSCLIVRFLIKLLKVMFPLKLLNLELHMAAAAPEALVRCLIKGADISAQPANFNGR